MGHKGWVYCLFLNKELLFSGGDDRAVRIWDLNTTICLDNLTAHRNGVTSIVICAKKLITGGFDHYVISYDLDEVMERVNEKKMMREEDILSRKMEVYYRHLV